jgi:exopolyphosphatase/guanosine-5'-triphosphate,3'-diphosphate pyrophosphatase
MIHSSQGRLQDRRPLAVIDIGSNSVRLVVYEGVTRSPTILFNEKMMAGLGRGIVATGRLDEEAVRRAVEELRRFRALAEQAGAVSLHAIATAAAREAENGMDFVHRAEDILGVPIQVLSGKEEAGYSASGVSAAFYRADGITGDLGGGSLELVDIAGDEIGEGVTLPLGGLRLQEMAKDSPAAAARIARAELRRADFLAGGRGRTLYCVGGTWRNLARLHMLSTNYALPVMHNYELPLDEMDAFLKLVAYGDMSQVRGVRRISKTRRALLPYGAVVLREIIDAMRPHRLIISAVGVREGYIHALLSQEERRRDPLIAAAEELAILRARSVTHARELAAWTDEAFAVFGIEETEDEARYRRAACLLADIGWRAHPEYRGTQSLNIIAHASFIGIDHPGRAFIALANLFRHEGIYEDDISPAMKLLAGPRYLERARILGGLLRVVYLFSAAMPGMMPKLKWRAGEGRKLSLVVPARHADLMGERPASRMAILAKALDRPMEIVVGEE